MYDVSVIAGVRREDQRMEGGTIGTAFKVKITKFPSRRYTYPHHVTASTYIDPMGS